MGMLERLSGTLPDIDDGDDQERALAALAFERERVRQMHEMVDFERDQYRATIVALETDLAATRGIARRQRETIERLQDENRRLRERRGGWGDR